MLRPADPEGDRAAYEAVLARLTGARLDDVTYHDLDGEAATDDWDRGDWHCAVMGVDLATAAGPVSVVWTPRFQQIGVEAVPGPLPAGPGGRRWSVRDHPRWHGRVGAPVRAATVLWETVAMGPAARQGDGVVLEEAYDLEVPSVLRLDFDAGPVWFTVPGDEVHVAFTADHLT